MAEYLVQDTELIEIANAIRNKTGKTEPIAFEKIAGEIASIEIGGGVNFKIIGGTTQPTNPTENTIWINTSTEIPTYVFSVEQPESPLEGIIWIRTTTDSPVEFNALAEGILWIYPDSAKQYVSGAWVDVAPLSYLNGAWVDWINYLFKAGATSGLSRVAWKGHAYQSTGAPSVSYASDGAYVRGAGSPGQNGVAYFDAIDLTNISKITFSLTVTGIDRPTDYIKCDCVGVWKTIGSGVYGDSAAAHATLYNGSGKQTYTLNVSGLSGLYYVGVGARTGTNSNTLIVIHEIILS